MKRSVVSLLTIAAFVFGMVSCSGGKKAKEESTEEAAVIAGNIPKSLLTEELKTETIRLLNDLPDTEIPARFKAGDISVSVGNLQYMLPVAKATDLTTTSQKARAIGIYFADYTVLSAIGQATTETEAVLTKLTTDLNIPYVLNILKEAAPADAKQISAFYKEQENKVVKALADDDKMNIAIDILGGAAAEYACVVANPSLVVKGDATSAGLSVNMERRVEVLGEITGDLSAYYPEMKNLGETIIPLKDKVASIQAARSANAEIKGIRDTLLK